MFKKYMVAFLMLYSSITYSNYSKAQKVTFLFSSVVGHSIQAGGLFYGIYKAENIFPVRESSIFLNHLIDLEVWLFKSLIGLNTFTYCSDLLKTENLMQSLSLQDDDSLLHVFQTGFAKGLFHFLLIKRAYAPVAPTVTDPKNAITFSDIAGMTQAKEEVREIIEYIKNPQTYQELGIKVSKGILFDGPPGNGKTLFARAVAGEAGCSFLAYSALDLQGKYIGESAERVRNAFNNARDQAPCIIFIDEIDSIAEDRNKHINAYSGEALNQLLTEMDGFNQQNPNKPIIVIAATNRPNALDPAILRPGRLDLHITISLPDLQTRLELLKLYDSKVKLDPSCNLDEIAHITEGCGCAELTHLMNRAALMAFRKKLPAITQTELLEATQELKTRHR